MSREIDPQKFSTELDDLIPSVRKKAIELAEKMLREDDELTEQEALERGIKLAERFYLDRAG